MVFQRVSGASGLAGKWQAKNFKSSSPAVLELAASGTNGLAYKVPEQGLTCDSKLDGKDYPCTGPTIASGWTVALAKSGDRVVDMTAKMNGKVLYKVTYTVSADGKTLSGTLSQGGASLPFSVTRTGDAKIEPLPKSTPVTKDVEGSWDATLDADGKLLRLALKLSNTPAGTGTGTIVSVDQGGAEVPIASVVQTGTHLKLLLPTVAGAFDGDLVVASVSRQHRGREREAKVELILERGRLEIIGRLRRAFRQVWVESLDEGLVDSNSSLDKLHWM